MLCVYMYQSKTKKDMLQMINTSHSSMTNAPGASTDSDHNTTTEVHNNTTFTEANTPTTHNDKESDDNDEINNAMNMSTDEVALMLRELILSKQSIQKMRKKVKREN